MNNQCAPGVERFDPGLYGLNWEVPTAVSPESMTASVPSKIVFATSVVSAWLDGVSFHAVQHLRCDDETPTLIGCTDQLFLETGTCSNGISTPKSCSGDHVPSTDSGIPVDVLYGLRLFDLGDDGQLFSAQLIECLQVLTSSCANKERARNLTRSDARPSLRDPLPSGPLEY